MNALCASRSTANLDISLNIFLVYAPIIAVEDASIEQLYQTLETNLLTMSGRETWSLGDFNAKVGENVNNNHVRSAVGKFGLGNERGERFIQFCIDNKFTITNTVHKHKRRLCTWRSADVLHKNQRDRLYSYSVMLEGSSIRIKTLPSADCGSDQLLMSLKLNLKSALKLRWINNLES